MKPLPFRFGRIVCVVAGMMTSLAVANAGAAFLGPSNPGAENGSAGWFEDTKGRGSVSIGDSDPARGLYYFSISNSIPLRINCADWRSKPFSLKQAQDGRQPITLSFAYKLLDLVNLGDDIPVRLRFFDMQDNFLSEKIVFVGSNSGDSEMTHYKTMVTADILAPKQARFADIWVTANIFEPWSSGTAQFDDFSVTTSSNSGTLIIVGVGATVFIIVIGLVYWMFYDARQRKKRQMAV
jgi:hypothetical protein